MSDWEYPRTDADHRKRTEILAAHLRWANSDQAKQILMPYRQGEGRNRYAAIEPGFEFKPGYIYTQVRAISARINQNYDAWPSDELKKSFRTFIGKPCFVNHQNFDPKKARGKVVAARYVDAGNGDRYVDTVMEIDAQRFPKLAHELKTGGLDSVSMGVEAGFTKCSICDNKAIDVPDFCAHVKYHKGSYLPHARTGKRTLVYENCYRLGFFELSYVFDPADETAVVSRVIAASNTGPQTPRRNPKYERPWNRPETYRGKPNQLVDLQRGETPDEDERSDFDLIAKVAAAEEAPPPDEIVEGQMPTGQMPTAAKLPGPGEEPRFQVGDRVYTPGHKGRPTPQKVLEVHTDDDGHRYKTTDGILWRDHQVASPISGDPKYSSSFTAALERKIDRLAEYTGTGDVEKKSGPFAGEDDTFPVGTPKDKNDAKDVCNFPSVKSKHPGTCDKIEHMSAVEARIHRLAYGENEAPEDIDTLRDEDGDNTDDFKHYVEPINKDTGTDDFKNLIESPEELQNPNTDRTIQLDRAQEDEGLDTPRRAEQVEDVGGHLMDQEPRNSDRRDIEEIKLMAHTLVDPRTGRRYYAADDEDQGPPPDFGGGDEGGDDFGGGGDDSDFGGEDGGDDAHKSDEELLQEAEEDLGKAEAAGAGEEFGGGDDGGEGDWGDDDSGDDSGDDFSGDDDLDDAGGSPDEDVPPWLAEGGDEGGEGGDDEDFGPSPHEARRRRSNNRRNTKKGRPMSLSQRNRVATAGRRRHYAEDGYTDGGPYGENTQGEDDKDVYLSETPGAEAVAAPTPGDGTISNTENNLVARKLQQRIQARNAELRRDLIAYEQITGQRIGSRRTAEDDNLPNLPDESVKGAEHPDKVDPTVDDPAGEKLTGDNFTSVALDGGSGAETQPKDASVRAFRAFDNWLARTTGRTARQHGNASFIRRSAAHYCQASGVSVEALFPTLGSVLRQARKNERSSSMKRRADEKLDVAAPQDRIDVEAPVRDTTDQEAQASQYSERDFGDNAGDNLADPELSTDSQIWAPGEGDSAAGSSKESNRKADGMTAVRYAEAFIAAGLAPNTPEEKWKIAGLAQNMRLATIRDRIGLLDAFTQVRQASARRTASAPQRRSGIPQGLSQRQLTAGTNNGASDPSSDFALFLKS